MFPLEAQRGAAGHEQGQVRTGGQQLSKPRPGGQHVFEVVEQQQERLFAQHCEQLLQQPASTGIPQSQRLGNGWEDEVGIVDGSQGHKADAGEVDCEGLRHREAQARFADPPWTGEGEQANLRSTEQGHELRKFLLAAKQGGYWHGQARW